MRKLKQDDLEMASIFKKGLSCSNDRRLNITVHTPYLRVAFL